MRNLKSKFKLSIKDNNVQSLKIVALLSLDFSWFAFVIIHTSVLEKTLFGFYWKKIFGYKNSLEVKMLLIFFYSFSQFYKLRDYFVDTESLSRYCDFRDCRVVKDSGSGKSKGYGFVSFLKKEVCIYLQTLLTMSYLARWIQENVMYCCQGVLLLSCLSSLTAQVRFYLGYCNFSLSLFFSLFITALNCIMKSIQVD